MMAFDSPRLIADIGGLYARFAIETSYGEFVQQRSLRCADFPSFEAAVAAYLASLKSAPVAHASVAIANPVDGDQVRMTNYHWQFSIEETRLNLGLETLVVVNDFTSLAMALPRLGPQDFRQVGSGQAVHRQRHHAGTLSPGRRSDAADQGRPNPDPGQSHQRSRQHPQPHGRQGFDQGRRYRQD